MDFYTGVHEDHGEEMGLEQEGATDPAKAGSVGRNRSGESTIGRCHGACQAAD